MFAILLLSTANCNQQVHYVFKHTFQALWVLHIIACSYYFLSFTSSVLALDLYSSNCIDKLYCHSTHVSMIMNLYASRISVTMG